MIMSLAEGVQASIRYKKYATGVITSNAQAVSTTDPANTGGQLLRRVSSSLKLAKDTYQASEIRDDRQVVDFRHGKKSVSGSISGEFSPGTYFDFIEAACRGTRGSAVALTEAQLTSAAFDSALSQVTFVAGDPIALGLRVGDVLNFTNLATVGNNATNFLITGFSGTNNRVVGIYPPPITEAADTTFSVTTVGKSISVPSTGFTSRKFAFEIFNSDVDVSRLYTECRVAGFGIKLPASGMSTIDVSVMGRDMEVLTGGSAPFFTSPAAATTTGVCAAVNGLLRVGGVTVGVVTGLDISMDLKASADAVVGQNFVPEIFLGSANVSGTVTAFFEDATLINDFKNETEVSILAYLTANSQPNSPAVTIFLPRIKFGDADVATSGDGGQAISLPFTALKGAGTALGEEATTIRIIDSAAT
jgi:hypothetical protein